MCTLCFISVSNVKSRESYLASNHHAFLYINNTQASSNKCKKRLFSKLSACLKLSMACAPPSFANRTDYQTRQ